MIREDSLSIWGGIGISPKPGKNPMPLLNQHFENCQNCGMVISVCQLLYDRHSILIRAIPFKNADGRKQENWSYMGVPQMLFIV